jgi:ABC-type multidrug transport system fused ATPase/permease subunit
MKSPIEFFFSLGDKVTKGDQKRKADFDYYMLWVMFIAFVSVFVGYVKAFYDSLELTKLGWAFVILCILWFQYYTLKSAREARKYMKSNPPLNKQQEEKIENIEDMIKGFDKKEEKISKNKKKSTKKEKKKIGFFSKFIKLKGGRDAHG